MDFVIPQGYTGASGSTWYRGAGINVGTATRANPRLWPPFLRMPRKNSPRRSARMDTWAAAHCTAARATRAYTARTDLSAAIRADIKAAGIKGVTVKCKSYSGGQSITATIRTSPADYVDEADYIAAYRVRGNWVYDGERSIYIGDFIRRLPIQSAQESRAILSGKSPPLMRLLGVAQCSAAFSAKKEQAFRACSF